MCVCVQSHLSYSFRDIAQNQIVVELASSKHPVLCVLYRTLSIEVKEPLIVRVQRVNSKLSRARRGCWFGVGCVSVCAIVRFQPRTHSLSSLLALFLSYLSHLPHPIAHLFHYLDASPFSVQVLAPATACTLQRNLGQLQIAVPDLPPSSPCYLHLDLSLAATGLYTAQS